MGQIITPDGSYSGTDIRIYAIINNSIIRDIGDATALDLEIPLIYQTSNGDLRTVDPPAKKTPKLPQIKLIELAEAQTISYSVYRGKRAVNTLGNSNANGFTRGYRAIAGTIIFTVIKQRAMHELLNQLYVWDTADGQILLDSITIDQLPPIDIFISFENELGNRSKLTIFGADFMNEGQVMSVQDLITENSVNYLAKYISPMRSYDSDKLYISDLQNSTNIGGIPVSVNDYKKAAEEIKNFKRRFL